MDAPERAHGLVSSRCEAPKAMGVPPVDPPCQWAAGLHFAAHFGAHLAAAHLVALA